MIQLGIILKKIFCKVKPEIFLRNSLRKVRLDNISQNIIRKKLNSTKFYETAFVKIKPGNILRNVIRKVKQDNIS